MTLNYCNDLILFIAFVTGIHIDKFAESFFRYTNAPNLNTYARFYYTNLIHFVFSYKDKNIRYIKHPYKINLAMGVRERGTVSSKVRDIELYILMGRKGNKQIYCRSSFCCEASEDTSAHCLGGSSVPGQSEPFETSVEMFSCSIRIISEYCTSAD